MNKRNLGALVLTVTSLVLLVPGLYLPILSINIGAKIPLLGEISLHDTKQSILQTIQSLFKNGNSIVAALILFFSIVIPIIKAFAMLVAIGSNKPDLQEKIGGVLTIIGKWSMADVFIVGVFIAFLSTSSEDNIDASIHNGFYFFLAYCILSILAFQIFTVKYSQ